MAIQQNLLVFCLLAFVPALLATTSTDHGVKPKPYSMPFNRTIFPAGFTFGAGSASYQSEGGASIDGRGPSIWDTFTKNHPEGKISGGVNPLGVKFYNNVIDELLANGMKPFVTLFHWDLPQALEDKYGGFLSSEIVKDFRDYADFCFKTFGDRVKHWVTMNEPYSFSVNGYNGGTFAPGRCSSYMGNCTAGDSSTEPYIVAHNLLLSHAAAVKVYRTKYQAYQKGKIGITIVTHWFIPKSPKSEADKEAANRILDFLFGWFADPITYGNYPKIMRSLVGDRLPKFTKAQSEMLRGSFDFLGVNYYTTNYAQHSLTVPKFNKSYSTDSRVTPSFGNRMATNGLRNDKSFEDVEQQLVAAIWQCYNEIDFLIQFCGRSSDDMTTK
ncbi:hypothetical protein LWI28_028772 [Acer negundo]|uniref:Uncharacterized protein n=1 Tax=Acer negundo TaxID=4023 RepID=A0AAD5JNL8_ACENE|nr:hypothetical protein LWI28_028772 [Acer negundo]